MGSWGALFRRGLGEFVERVKEGGGRMTTARISRWVEMVMEDILEPPSRPFSVLGWCWRVIVMCRDFRFYFTYRESALKEPEMSFAF